MLCALLPEGLRLKMEVLRSHPASLLRCSGENRQCQIECFCQRLYLSA